MYIFFIFTLKVDMVKELGKHQGFTPEFLPPDDMSWGALQEEGYFTGNYG